MLFQDSPSQAVCMIQSHTDPNAQGIPCTALLQQIVQAVAGGVSLVQVRDTSPAATDRSRAALARHLALALADTPCAVVLNGDVASAIACGVDGVHLPERLMEEGLTLARSAITQQRKQHQQQYAAAAADTSAARPPFQGSLAKAAITHADEDE